MVGRRLGIDCISNLKKSPLDRPISKYGSISIVLLTLAVLSNTLHLPWFYLYFHVSQEIFIILFLNIFVLVFCFGLHKTLSLSVPHGLLLLIWFVAAFNNFHNYAVVATFTTYLIIVFIGSERFFWFRISIVISFIAIISAVLSYGFYNASYLGVYPHISARLGGMYGQPNLLAAMLLLGLFHYAYLLSVLKRQSCIYFTPVFLLSTILFMTGSRAALMAICFVLLITVFKWRDRAMRGQHHFVSIFFLVVLAGYVIANLVGDMTIVDRVVTSAFGNGAGIYKRLVYWLAGVLMGVEHLASGMGAGGYPAMLGDYAIRAAEILHFPYRYVGQTLWAHNDFIHIFAEYGAFVGGLLLFFVMLIGMNALKHLSRVSFFPFLAFVSFAVMVCFGHPLYSPGLAFVACLSILPLLGHYKGRRFHIGRKIYIPVLLSLLVIINIFMLGHFYNTYNFNQFHRYWKKSTAPLLVRYQQGERLYLNGAMGDSLYGWRFKHELYCNLARFVKKEDDRKLAGYIQPEMLEYAEQNRFSTFLFALSEVYYVLGDYDQAKHFAREAYVRKPDVNKYFDMEHLCNMLIISHDNGIPLKQLMPEDIFAEMLEQKALRPRQIDTRGIAF